MVSVIAAEKTMSPGINFFRLEGHLPQGDYKAEFQSLSHVFVILGNMVSLCLVEDNQEDVLTIQIQVSLEAKSYVTLPSICFLVSSCSIPLLPSSVFRNDYRPWTSRYLLLFLIFFVCLFTSFKLSLLCSRSTQVTVPTSLEAVSFPPSLYSSLGRLQSSLV